MDLRQQTSDIKNNPFQDPSPAQQVSHCASLPSLLDNSYTGKEEIRPQTSSPKDTPFLWSKLLSSNHQIDEVSRQGRINKFSNPENGYKTSDDESNCEDEPLLKVESSTMPDTTDTSMNLLRKPKSDTLEQEHSDTFNKASSGKREKRAHFLLRFLSCEPRTTRDAVPDAHFSRNSSKVSLRTACTSRQSPKPVRREPVPGSCTVDVTGNEGCTGADTSSTTVNIGSDIPEAKCKIQRPLSDQAHSNTVAANPSNSDWAPQSHEPERHNIIITLVVLVVFMLLIVLFLFGGFGYLLGHLSAPDNKIIKVLGVSTHSLSRIII